jgi:hypothetical protein
MRPLKTMPIIAAIAAAGCVTEAPTGPDAERPTVSVQVQNAVGGAKIFRSTDPATDSACVKVRSFPAKLVLSAGDAGGVNRVMLRVFPGTIDRGSILVPTSADISYTVTPAGRGETLVISLTRPAPGRVRTGVVATLDAVGPDGALPDFAVTAEASDYAGNRAFVQQVDIRPADSPVICE